MTDKFDPYMALGVSRDATAEEITAAYRREAQKAHPDREGGSVERMTDVNMAYKILGDPAMRAEFDRTGGVAPKDELLRKAREHLVQMVRVMIRGSSPTANMIALLKDGIAKQREGCRESRMKTQSELAMLRDRLRRLHGPKDNFIETLLLQEIVRGEEHLPHYDKDEEVLARAAELLQDFWYDTSLLQTAGILSSAPSPFSGLYGVLGNSAGG